MQQTKSTCCYCRVDCGVDHDCVAEKQLALTDAIGAWVCRLSVGAAVLLVVVLAARS